MLEIETERLLIRGWEDDDLAPFAAICADPHVMEYFPAPLSFEQACERFERMRAPLAKARLSFQPVIEKSSGRFIGIAGLADVDFKAHFTPAIEIGWSLDYSSWRKGYASEAARAHLDYGFRQQNLAEIVAFTFKDNQRSRAVMARLGMVRDLTGDFLHPNLSANHRLAPHVLYRLSRP